MKKNIIKIIQIILALLVAILLLIQIFQKLYPDKNGFLGFKTFVIVSESMAPKLRTGDVILVKYENPKDIKINDIITYQGQSENYKNKIITHQVKNIMQEGKRYIFYTKGMSNSGIDPAVYEEQVYGVMKYKFTILSLISRVIKSKLGFIIFIIIPLSILLYGEIRDIKKEIDERR